MPRSPTLAILDRILTATKYREYLMEENDILTDDRLENVEELRRALREYDVSNPRGSLEEFLNETALVRSRAAEETGEPCVTLMTLHSAKGLEFPYVFLAACEEGLLPHARSQEDEAGIEEERRLFYVGITRAQKKLTLTYARTRQGTGSGGGFTIASRFLAEIPRESIEELETGERAFAAGMGGERSRASTLSQESTYEPSFDSHEPPFSAGDRVEHDRFGVGNVVSLSGFGPSARVTVDFEQHGTRQLILEFAKLRKAY
jgi:DNA helicase II / ATP-dependent DNA helicase PcrA